MGRQHYIGIGLFLGGTALGAAIMFAARPARGIPEVSIARVAPDGNADNADRLAIVFDRPIAKPDAIDRPVEPSPFSLEPARKGAWVWATDDRLEYRLDEKLAPGRIYRIRPTEHLASALGARLVGDSQFEFRTSPLAVESVDVESADRSHVNVRVHFNQPVLPTELTKRLTVVDAKNQSSLELQCLTREPSADHTIRFARPDSDRASLKIDGALTGANGELGLGAAFAQVFKLDAPFDIESARCWPDAFDDEIEVALDFSRWLKYDQSVPRVRVEPSVGPVTVRVSGDELRVAGAFECGRRYSFAVESGLVADDGTILSESATTSLRIPDRRAAVRIPQTGGILSPSGNMQLEMQVVNCPRVRFEATRVYANNLVAHLHGNDEREVGKSVAEKSIDITAARNEPTTALLDLAELLPPVTGVYRVRVESSESRWNDDSAVVAVTDLGINCQKDADGVFVWITSIATARPVAGVEVEARSYADQLLATATTGDDGLARLKIPEHHTDGPPWLIVARKENDTSFHQLDRNIYSPADFDPSGADPVRNYDVCLYTERGAYRPGDAIHLTGIIRDESGATPPPFPLIVRVNRPDGREIATRTVTPTADRQGMFHLDLDTREEFQLGRYTMTASIPGSDRALGETSALVEAFLPVRMDVSASATQPVFAGDDKPTVTVQADYLFGKPAANLPVTIAGTYRQIGFDDEVLKGYHFGPMTVSAESVIEEQSLQLDDNGHVKINVPHAEKKPVGRWQAQLHVTVSEPGSRSVSANTTLISDPLDRHVGIRCASGNAVSVPGEVDINWIQVDGHGKPAAPGPVRMTIERIEYDWVIRDHGGTRRWESVERNIPIVKRTLERDDATDTNETTAAIKTAGLYRVRLTDVQSGTIAEAQFYGHAGQNFDESFATQLPEVIDLQLDQPTYRPGDTAKVAVRSAITGTLLVTLETDRVIQSQVIEMFRSTQTVDISIPADLRRDAFIGAVVVRPLDKNAESWKPMRGRGIVRLPINHKDKSLRLAIDAPETVEPQQTIQVAVKTNLDSNDDRNRTNDNSEADEKAIQTPPIVHLWAVDDGILATTAFRTPDPFRHFYASRRRTIESSDLFAELIPDFARPESVLRIGAGGDDFDAESIDRSPVSMKRRGGDVLWLESRTTDADGTARFELVMPESQGRLRLMATTVGGDRFGKAETPVKIVAPITIETQFARFLAPNDEWQLPARVFNNTDGDLDVRLAAGVEGPASIVFDDEASNTVSVPAGQSEIIWLKSNATDMGQANYQLTATAEDANGTALSTRTQGIVPIRPVTSIRTVSMIHRLNAGEPFTISPPADLLAKTIQSRLRISPDPRSSLEPAYDSLVEYPYGCVEQTSSRLRALICAREWMPPDEFKNSNIDKMIRAGIARLWGMQTSNGGLAYWSGQSTPDAWGTAYAATVLVDVSAAGYAIDASFLKDLTGYLESELRSTNDDTRQTRPMIAYALSRFDRPPLGEMASMTEHADGLDAEARAFLARAWVAAGRRDMAEKLLTPESFTLVGIRSRDGRITSPVSQHAALLEAALDCDADSPWSPQLIDQIMAAQVNGAWGTTRDTAACLSALIRCKRDDDQPAEYSGHLVRGDDSFDFDSRQAMTHRFDGPEEIRVETQGQGQLTVACIQRGLGIEGDNPEQYDRGLRVRRRWLTTDGKPVDIEKLAVGDLIRVEVSIAAPGLADGESVPNVAIVDLLPACFEAENPALATSAVISVSPNAIKLDSIQYQDDRIVAFAAVPKNEAIIEYHVRVVALGSFAVPPIEASCMYDPMLASRHGGGRMVVMQ